MKKLFALMLIIALSAAMTCGAVLKKPYSTEPTAEIWNTYSSELRYYYNQLSEAEKRLFSARYDSLALGDKSLWGYRFDGASLDSIQRVNLVIMWDCPELMYVPDTGEFNLYYTLQAPDDEYYRQSPTALNHKLDKCLEAIDLIATNAKPGDDFAFELALDRYLAQSCSYAAIGYAVYKYAPITESADTAYSALVMGQARCMGYSGAALLALRRMGIQSAAALGSCSGETGKTYGHAWNFVRIDGQWYHYDPTWNDSDNSHLLTDYYPYLNLTTIDIKTDHSYSPAVAQLGFNVPRCTSNYKNYYKSVNRFMDREAQWQDVYEPLKQAYTDGEKGMGFRFSDDELYQDVLKHIGHQRWFESVFAGFDFVINDNLRFVYFYRAV